MIKMRIITIFAVVFVFLALAGNVSAIIDQMTGLDICGDGNVQSGEACDGTNFNGRSCSDFGFTGGTLGCSSDCSQFDTSQCYSYCSSGYCYGDSSLSCSQWNGQPEYCLSDYCSYSGDSCSNNYNTNCYDYSSYPQNCQEVGCSWAGSGNVCAGDDLNGKACTDVFGLKGNKFVLGVLGCNSNCGFDVSGCEEGINCGNGNVDYGEQCDGANFNGESCLSQNFTTGDLKCGSDCTIDTSNCTNGGTGGDCGDGATRCDNVGCVYLDSDTNNCGSCGRQCLVGEWCERGSCVSCSGNEFACFFGDNNLAFCSCDGSCFDLRNDVDNCGSCGNQCPSGASCSGGSCACPGNQKICTETNEYGRDVGVCVDTTSNDKHCGSCAPCGIREYCIDSKCEKALCENPPPTNAVMSFVKGVVASFASFSNSIFGTSFSTASTSEESCGTCPNGGEYPNCNPPPCSSESPLCQPGETQSCDVGEGSKTCNDDYCSWNMSQCQTDTCTNTCNSETQTQEPYPDCSCKDKTCTNLCPGSNNNYPTNYPQCNNCPSEQCTNTCGTTETQKPYPDCSCECNSGSSGGGTGNPGGGSGGAGSGSSLNTPRNPSQFVAAMRAERVRQIDILTSRGLITPDEKKLLKELLDKLRNSGELSVEERNAIRRAEERYPNLSPFSSSGLQDMDTPEYRAKSQYANALDEAKSSPSAALRLVSHWFAYFLLPVIPSPLQAGGPTLKPMDLYQGPSVYGLQSWDTHLLNFALTGLNLLAPTILSPTATVTKGALEQALEKSPGVMKAIGGRVMDIPMPTIIPRSNPLLAPGGTIWNYWKSIFNFGPKKAIGGRGLSIEQLLVRQATTSMEIKEALKKLRGVNLKTVSTEDLQKIWLDLNNINWKGLSKDEIALISKTAAERPSVINLNPEELAQLGVVWDPSKNVYRKGEVISEGDYVPNGKGILGELQDRARISGQPEPQLPTSVPTPTTVSPGDIAAAQANNNANVLIKEGGGNPAQQSNIVSKEELNRLRGQIQREKAERDRMGRDPSGERSGIWSLDEINKAIKKQAELKGAEKKVASGAPVSWEDMPLNAKADSELIVETNGDMLKHELRTGSATMVDGQVSINVDVSSQGLINSFGEGEVGFSVSLKGPIERVVVPSHLSEDAVSNLKKAIDAYNDNIYRSNPGLPRKPVEIGNYAPLQPGLLSEQLSAQRASINYGANPDAVDDMRRLAEGYALQSPTDFPVGSPLRNADMPYRVRATELGEGAYQFDYYVVDPKNVKLQGQKVTFYVYPSDISAFPSSLSDAQKLQAALDLKLAEKIIAFERNPSTGVLSGNQLTPTELYWNEQANLLQTGYHTAGHMKDAAAGGNKLAALVHDLDPVLDVDSPLGVYLKDKGLGGRGPNTPASLARTDALLELYQRTGQTTEWTKYDPTGRIKNMLEGINIKADNVAQARAEISISDFPFNGNSLARVRANMASQTMKTFDAAWEFAVDDMSMSFARSPEVYIDEKLPGLARELGGTPESWGKGTGTFFINMMEDRRVMLQNLKVELYGPNALELPTAAEILVKKLPRETLARMDANLRGVFEYNKVLDWGGSKLQAENAWKAAYIKSMNLYNAGLR